LHLWNSDWYHDTSIIKFALKFSKINKIVENKTWANLKDENGLDGGWSHINNDIDIREKIHDTKKKKYGDDYMSILTSEHAKEKREKTCIEKYGVLNTLLSEEIREKQKSKLKENYGVEIPYKSEEIRSRGKNTLMERYGVNNPMHLDSSKEKIKREWERKRKNPEKYKKRFVNNGIIEIKIGINEITPEGFFDGKLPPKHIEITDGINSMTILEKEPIPEGWFRGNAKKRNKILINNGKVEKRIKPSESIPEGFERGGLKRPFYTNGTENKRIKIGEKIPMGFVPGRTLNK
jgi:hypothetical protein